MKWEMNRTNWAVKAGDLLPVLVEASLITREQAEALPEYFGKPTAAGEGADSALAYYWDHAKELDRNIERRLEKAEKLRVAARLPRFSKIKSPLLQHLTESC